MAETKPHISVGIVSEYDKSVMQAIGDCMPALDASFSPWAMPEDTFQKYFMGPGPDPERSMFIVERNEHIIGTFVLQRIIEQHWQAWSAELNGFVITEEARGTGAAQIAWQHMLQWCRDNGLAKLTLNTETSRTAAIKFYERMGATQIPGTVGHYTATVPERIITTAVPQDVIRGFFGDTTTTTGSFGNGLINRTFLANSRGQRRILQELNAAFDQALVADNAAVAGKLAVAGWDTPQTIPTVDGALWHRDQLDRLWRQLSFIESDGGVPSVLSQESLYDVGALLGKLHTTLATLDYKPTSGIEHFHDTAYYAGHLEGLKHRLPNSEARDLANDLLHAYRALPKLPLEKPQLIHGDPQLTNILFRDGKPYTYIDFDTVMQGSIWLDIGDLLRATLANGLAADHAPAAETLHAIVEGYRTVARPEANSATFYATALLATQHIALELAMRFMNDMVDTDYFAWDSNRFPDKQSSHLAQVRLQWRMYQIIRDLQETTRYA